MEDLKAAYNVALAAIRGATPPLAACAAAAAASVHPSVSVIAANLVPDALDNQTQAERNIELIEQCHLFRCIFGNPFHPLPAITASVLAWNDHCVAKIAEAIYQERRWGNVVILADALEEAGCDDTSILEHLRGPGPHCRGCYVVDLILGRD